MLNKHLVIEPRDMKCLWFLLVAKGITALLCLRYLLLGSIFPHWFYDFWGYLCDNIFFKFFLTFSFLWRRPVMSLHCWLFLIIQAVMQQWHVYIDLCFFAIFVFWSGMYATLKASLFFFFVETRSQTCSQEEVNLLRREREKLLPEKDALKLSSCTIRALNDIQKEIICLRWVKHLFLGGSSSPD